MKENHAHLTINKLELHVNLGWHNDEKANLQKVLLDIEIQFAEPPKACDSDKLEDTACYATLIESLSQHVSKKTYSLVEHLGKDIHQQVSSLLPQAEYIAIALTKFPAIKGLTGGVTFTYV